MKMLKRLAYTSVALAMVATSASADTAFQSWSGQVYDQSAQPTILTPRNLDEVVSVVKQASAAKRKIRVSGARHSWNSVILSDTSTYISTAKLNRIGPIQTKGGKRVVTVGAGVMLGTLTDNLFKRGYSLGFAMPEYRGLTIGGLLATGSHGSSRRHPGVANQIVTQLQLVTADGAVRELTPKDGDLFKAATVNLGVLGVVTQLDLVVVPRFNLKVTSSVMDLETESLSAFLRASPEEDFLFVVWFPRLKKALLESGVMTREPAEPGAENVVFGLNLPPTPADHAVAEALAKGRADASGQVEAAIEAKRYAGLVQKPRFVVKENGIDTPKAVVTGPANRMLLARGETITWVYKLSDYSFAFPISKLDGVMGTIEAFSHQKNYSFPNAGISMRFVRSDGAESALISQYNSGDQRNVLMVSAEFLEFRPLNHKGPTNGPRDELRNQLLALLVSRHGVQLHHGKNDDLLLRSQPASRNSIEHYSRFRNVARELDPDGIFMTDFVGDILRKRSGR